MTVKVINGMGASGMKAVDDSCVFLLSKDDYPLHHHIIITGSTLI